MSNTSKYRKKLSKATFANGVVFEEEPCESVEPLW